MQKLYNNCMQQIQIIEQTYGDGTVLINNMFIKIYKYYFPLATSKTIFYNQIDQIIFHSGMGNITPIWGVNPKCLNNWFGLDQLRKRKNAYFQIIMKNNAIRPSFSPQDPQRAFKVLWENHSKQGGEYLKKVEQSNQKITNEILASQKQKQLDQETMNNQSESKDQPLKPLEQIQIIQGKTQKKQLMAVFGDLTNKILRKERSGKKVTMKQAFSQSSQSQGQDQGQKQKQNKVFLSQNQNSFQDLQA